MRNIVTEAIALHCPDKSWTTGNLVDKDISGFFFLKRGNRKNKIKFAYPSFCTIFKKGSVYLNMNFFRNYFPINLFQIKCFIFLYFVDFN